MDVLCTASPLRSAARFKLSMTPTGSDRSSSPGPDCTSPTWGSPGGLGEYFYGSDDEDLCGDGTDDGIALEDLYSFDREKIAALLQSGAGLDELTEAIWLDMVGSLERYLTSEQILNMANSGDGTMENVGIKVDGTFACHHCNQKFDSKQQRDIHCRFIHSGHQQVDPQQDALLEQAIACARRRHRRSIVRAVRRSDVGLNGEEADQTVGKAHVTLRKRRCSAAPLGSSSEHGSSALTNSSRLSPKADARVQHAIFTAMSSGGKMPVVLPVALLGEERAALQCRRRASIG